MTYPIPNLSRIWVRGRIIDLGKAATEQPKYGVGQAVTFAPSAKVLINSATQQIIASSAFRVNVSEDNGYFAIQLPASDDPDVNPTNFTYAVSEPGTGRSYNIIVPIATPLLNSPGDPLHGQPVIELHTVVPAPGPSAGLVQLVSGRGVESFDIVGDEFVVTYTDATTHVVGSVPAGGGEGGTVTPDATTSVKGKSVLLGGTAAAPTVPWSAVTGKPTIPELPELATVATTGAYSDLSGKPAIPSTKSDVGLSNVDNTPDAAKPVSSAVAAALADKVSVDDASLFTSAERTKLGGIAAGATVNATDAQLRDRATHTGTQTSTTISDFTEAVQDAVAALLGAGSNVTLNYDDAGNTLTVSATGSGGTGLDVEQVRDAIGVALVGVGNIAVTVNDAADTITVSTTATANSTDAQLRDRATHTGTQAASTVSGLATVATTGAYADLSGKPTIPATKSDVGLGNVDNTSDANKSVSTATQTALDGKVGTGDAALTNTRVPTDNSVTDAKVPSNAAINADKIADGTTNKVYTATEKTKLSGIATSATANATDAALRARSSHTGTQAASTVSGLATVATTGAYADLSGTPTIPAAYTDEQAQDAVAAMVAAGTHTGVSFSYNDAGNALSATVSASGDTVTPSTNVSGAVTIAAGSATKYMDYTANSGNVTFAVPTGTPSNHQQIHVTVLASGANRDITIHADISVMSGLTRVYTVPSGQVGRFALEYTSLGAKWRMNAFAISS